MTDTVNTDIVEQVKKGRKTKYVTDEERKAARKEQQKKYRERKKLEKKNKVEQENTDNEIKPNNKVLEKVRRINKALSLSE